MKAATKAMKKAPKSAAPKKGSAIKSAKAPKKPVSNSKVKAKAAVKVKPEKEQTPLQTVVQAMTEAMSGAPVAVPVVPSAQDMEAPADQTRSTAKAPAPAPKGERLIATEVENVKLRKIPAHADDVAEGDKSAPGRFEVLVGGVKEGEVAFRSVPKMKDGKPSGFRHYWQGEDTRGMVVFTDGRRMKDVVAQIVDVAQGRLGVTVGSVDATAKDSQL